MKKWKISKICKNKKIYISILKRYRVTIISLSFQSINTYINKYAVCQKFAVKYALIKIAKF